MQKLKTHENKSMKELLEYRFCHGTDIVTFKYFISEICSLKSSRHG